MPRIWIDLDNSPHVPFFRPIIRELTERGVTVLVTARDSYQVCELLDVYGVSASVVGRHYGKSKVLKVGGTVLRALQLRQSIGHPKPDLAVSHGSRGQQVLCAVTGIPTLVLSDYEHATALPLLRPSVHLVPEVLASGTTRFGVPTFGYPGIKEDIYVPDFRPDPSIYEELGIARDARYVTLRPPAEDAHYHRPESSDMFHFVADLLVSDTERTVVLLPRNFGQKERLTTKYSAALESGRMLIPSRAVKGLNLLYHSDFVVSGGGTMNREAAALGVPVVSIFQGAVGAVDRFLCQEGRLFLVRSTIEARERIAKLASNRAPRSDTLPNTACLNRVVDLIMSAMSGSRNGVDVPSV